MVKQSPGINEDVIIWMDKAYKEMGAGVYQRTGGLLCDEMTIQVG